MFSVNIISEKVTISSVEKDDIGYIEKWFNEQQSYYNQSLCHEKVKKHIETSEFYERFLEYYASECEFFSKVIYDGKIIGIIKGRVEFKNPNEVWIVCLLIDRDMKSMGIEEDIIRDIIRYFNEGYGICAFYSVISRKEGENFRIWTQNGFEMLRTTKNFYKDIDDSEIFILKRFCQ